MIKIESVNGVANHFRMVRDARPEMLVSHILPEDIAGQAVILGRLVTEFHGGTLVCEAYIPGDLPEDVDVHGETVTRFCTLFHDRGVFTPRA